MNFKAQAEKHMAHVATRNRNPVSASTLASYRSFLNKWILPNLGHMALADVHNGTVKPLIAALSSEGYAAQTITNIKGLIADVVASAVDENGNELYPRTWNNEFMDVPVIKHAEQKAPTATPKMVEKAIAKALAAGRPQDAGLYAVLAGSGIRIGEALALKIGPDNGKDSYWVPETGTLIIRSTVAKGVIQPTTKTEAGKREIDLAPEINEFLVKTLGLIEDGLVFRDEDGGLIRSNSTRLYDNMRSDGIPGFHSLRRFRLTYLDAAGASRGQIKAWGGHANKDITDRYINATIDVEARKMAAAKVGFGFQLGVA